MVYGLQESSSESHHGRFLDATMQIQSQAFTPGPGHMRRSMTTGFQNNTHA